MEHNVFGAMLAEELMTLGGKRYKWKSFNEGTLAELLQDAFNAGVEEAGIDREDRESTPDPISIAKAIASIKETALLCKAGQENDAFLLILSHCHKLQEVLSVCQTPPLGWACSRSAGHPGPCAAYDCSKKE